MKAIDQPFAKIINGTTQFVIPVFQRDYSWTETQCEQLWNDVLRMAKEKSDSRHFIGSIVYVSTGDSAATFTRWMLIDGQQRLTTLTLLVAALRDQIIETEWSGDDNDPTAKRLDAYFLKNLQEEGEREHKLVLRRHDRDTLCSIIDHKELPADPSERIKDNYEFFREQLENVDPSEVYRGIGRLLIVDVTLTYGVDDPQLIFQSLNSTGMDLSQSDLIRNFILMRLPEKVQTRLYEEYWSKIESLFRGSEKTFDAFIRDFLAITVRMSKQVKGDEIYETFRRELSEETNEPQSLEELLDELLRYAGYHAAFSIGVGAPVKLRKPLGRLCQLVDVPATVIMRLYDCYQRLKTLTEQEFVEAIELLESYVFRRAICGAQTRGYWQVFANMAYAIDETRPLESLKVAVARQPESYRFPTDEEFSTELQARDVYGMRVCAYLLERIENFENKEPTDTSKLSIEHIMPQNEKLVAEWREMLGPAWRETQKRWLHRLGNLTLTGYNSKYSDRPFEEKRKIPGGFADSAVRLNRFVREQKTWTPDQIEARGKRLAEQSLRIWPELQVDQSLIDAAREQEMRKRAAKRDVNAVKMSVKARDLFGSLSAQVCAIDDSIIELAEQKSISYHAPMFFMEVLPRKRRLNLLLRLDFNEIHDPPAIAEDATQWKFHIHAQHEGGVSVSIREPDHIDLAMPLIRQAFSLAQA